MNGGIDVTEYILFQCMDCGEHQAWKSNLADGRMCAFCNGHLKAINKDTKEWLGYKYDTTIHFNPKVVSNTTTRGVEAYELAEAFIMWAKHKGYKSFSFDTSTEDDGRVVISAKVGAHPLSKNSRN